MADPTTLYASGEDAIQRVIEVEEDDSPRLSTDKEYEEYYDIQRTTDAIVAGDYKRVWNIALRAVFMAHMLLDCITISR